MCQEFPVMYESGEILLLKMVMLDSGKRGKILRLLNCVTGIRQSRDLIA